jgi:EAL domain-containing protein (putative c-di-GMP-specific phosphodiesterase class I)
MIFMNTAMISIAFQPIVCVMTNKVTTFAYEALARDQKGRVPEALLNPGMSQSAYACDFTCRTQAIREAVALGLVENLTLNFMPGATCHPLYGIDATVSVAREMGFPIDRLILEITECEPVPDYQAIRTCIDHHRADGARLALDDFGAGFNGLHTMLQLNPDIVKVDMKLVQTIETDYARQSLMSAITAVGDRLGIRIVAEGVETSAGVAALRDVNVDLMQGYLFATPSIGSLPKLSPELEFSIVEMLTRAEPSELIH